MQPHCHHHSVMGFATDQQLLTGMGATLTVVSGCCGLAGNFGMEKGHYEMSVAVAENALLPALRDAPRAQHRAGRRLLLPDPDRPTRRLAQLTLAELLANHIAGSQPTPPAAKSPTQRSSRHIIEQTVKVFRNVQSR